jgi:hypothetical protein
MSKTVRLTLDTGNAAFDNDGDGNWEYEVAAIFQKASERLQDGERDFTLFDSNGNRVGSVITD